MLQHGPGRSYPGAPLSDRIGLTPGHQLPSADAHVREILDAAYVDAERAREVEIIVIPTSRVLPPVRPVKVAQGFDDRARHAIETAAKALDDIYRNPSPAVILQWAGELRAAGLAQTLGSTIEKS